MLRTPIKNIHVTLISGKGGANVRRTFTSQRVSYCVVLSESVPKHEKSANVTESSYYVIQFSINLILQIAYFLSIFAETLSKQQNEIVKRQRKINNPSRKTCKEILLLGEDICSLLVFRTFTMMVLRFAKIPEV